MIGKARTGRTLRGRPPETLWAQHTRAQDPFDQRFNPGPTGEAGAGKLSASTQGRSASVIEMQILTPGPSPPPICGDEGIVLNSRIQDDDEIVDVVFESVGIKRLAASLANLTILT